MELEDQKRKVVPKVRNQLLVGLLAGGVVSVFAIDYDQAVTVSDALIAIAVVLGPVVLGQFAGFLAAYQTSDPERELFYKLAAAMIDGNEGGSMSSYIKAIMEEWE